MSSWLRIPHAVRILTEVHKSLTTGSKSIIPAMQLLMWVACIFPMTRRVRSEVKFLMTILQRPQFQPVGFLCFGQTKTETRDHDISISNSQTQAKMLACFISMAG